MTELPPIGYVRNSAETPADLSDIVSRIEVLSEFVQGLEGIEDGEEIIVLFLFHRSLGYDLMVHPKGDERNPLIGVFASRSPRRPNPIGMTQVKLVRREGSSLFVEGLDALNGSPVIDIKPSVRRDQRDIKCK
jgi:tRNA-Thr(GGU) m(6)t(6)A37 methyltransferase TsaA